MVKSCPHLVTPSTVAAYQEAARKGLRQVRAGRGRGATQPLQECALLGSC